jgi:hypothetical protein
VGSWILLHTLTNALRLPRRWTRLVQLIDTTSLVGDQKSPHQSLVDNPRAEKGQRAAAAVQGLFSAPFFSTMSREAFPRRPPRPTCEDDYDDLEAGIEDTQMAANVAAKRSKPELHAKGSYERRRNNGIDSGYVSREGTAASGSPNRRETKATDLKIDTSFQERERQPYHYTSARTEARQSSGRPSADPPVSESAEPKKYYKHQEGVCWVCDKFGKHIDPPKDMPVPVSPTVARRAPVAEAYVTTQTSQVQPRTRRTSSNRSSRPVSMYAGTAAGGFYENNTLPSPFAQESPSYPMTSWHTTATPLTVQYTPHTPVTYTQYPVTTPSQIVTPVETQGSYFHALPPPKTRPAEPNRRASMYDQGDRPVVQQGKSTSARPREEKDRSSDRRPPLHAHRSSQDRDHDRRAMPPPPLPQQEQVLLARRPSIKKAATSTAASAVHRHSQSYEPDRDEFPRLEAIRERRAEASVPPTSYRGPSAAVPDRPPNRQSASYDHSKHDIEVVGRATSAAEPSTRRLTEPAGLERYEAEAEAYQRKRGTSDTHDLRSHNLTAEALRKVPKARALEARSETNSSQKSRNSSSKGSSGAKTGQSTSDITMRINGIALGIPADSGQRITIQSKGVNISVGGKGRSSDKDYASSRNGRTSSVASRTSKTSNSREKEKRVERDEGSRVLRDDEMRIPDSAGRKSQSISRYISRNEEEEAIGYGA